MRKALSVLLILFLSFPGCKQKLKTPQSEEFYLQCIDSYGREITLTKKPERLVSLSPGITEMIFLLNSEDKLVGITDFCTYPPETEGVQKVGGIQNFNIESLLLLNPDVVLVGSIVTKSDVEKLTALNIPVIAIREEERIEGIFDALTFLGELLDLSIVADSVVNELKNTLAGLPLNANADQKMSVYYVVGFGEAGDYTAPKSSHIHEIITKAGGKNIGESIKGWNVSREFLFQEDPDIIILRNEDLAQFVTLYPYNELSAVKAGRVYPIESGWMDIVSPRNILAIQRISEWVQKGKK